MAKVARLVGRKDKTAGSFSETSGRQLTDRSSLDNNLYGVAGNPGFKSAAKGIAKKQGLSVAKADAILASSSRHASKAAKKRNPRLKKVKG